MPKYKGFIVLLGLLITFSFKGEAVEKCALLSDGKCQIQLENGIQIAYLDSGGGDGRSLILLHGLTDTVLTWIGVAEALHQLDPMLRVIMLDQRGHGDSSMPPDSRCPTEPVSCFGVKLFAQDIIQFMDALRIDKVAVAGHSMGAIVAQQVALDYGDRIQAIILVAASGKTADNAIVRDYVLKDTVFGRWIKVLNAQGVTSPEALWQATPLDADPDIEQWLAEFWDVDPFADQQLVTDIIKSTSKVKLGTWIGASQGLLEYDNLDALKNIKVPTLVLWGIQDSFFSKDKDQIPLMAALEVAAKTNGIATIWKQYGSKPLSDTGIQSDIGHNIPWEIPEPLARDILSFLSIGKPTAQSYHVVNEEEGFKIIPR